MIKKPMLAGKCEDITKLTYPVLATPKLDGIRCLVIGGKALSRRFKPIPNHHIRNTIESEFSVYRADFDGEIMVHGRGFNDLSGDVRREEGKPDFYYAVFDRVLPDIVWGGLSQPYKDRMSALNVLSLPDCCEKIIPQKFKDPVSLGLYEADMLTHGYEGIMVRSVNSPYKCGRSTANEGYLLKVKRFEDSEALVIGYKEQMENKNPATRDAFGRTERSSHKENLVPKGTLGALECRLPNGVEFDVGTGYDQATRDKLWVKRDKLVGTTVKFKHQPSGADEKPRFPVFLGFRDEWDT